MAAGLGVLHLPPRDFWTMTPRELASAIEGLSGRRRAAPLGGAELAELMQLFPD
jgi:uncharacterized phage protein (TIGR02216 family)